MHKICIKKTVSLLLTATVLFWGCDALVRYEAYDDAFQVYNAVIDDSGQLKWLDEYGEEKEFDTGFSNIASIQFFSELPSYYSSVDEGIVSPVKNQVSTGLCWAFSTISMLETSMKMKNYPNDGFFDFSEMHLARFCIAGRETDTASPIYNDGFNFDGTVVSAYSGNPMLAAYTVLSGAGPALEENYGFFNGRLSAGEISYSEKYKSAAELTDLIEMNGSDTDDIKRAIMEYGSVSVFVDSNSISSGAYVPGSSANHVVTVVGWDDSRTFTVNNISYTGAWIFKNSWGSEWQDNGFGYVPYSDKVVSGAGAYVLSADKKEYHDIYQYTGFAPLGALGVRSDNITLANVFHNNHEYEESLNSFGTTVVNKNTEYELTIYVSDTKPDTPSSGTAVYQQTGVFPHTGYCKIELNDKVILKPDSYFSICIKHINPTGDNISFAVEGSGRSISSELPDITYGSHKGESWIYNGGWVDTSLLSYNNLPIKAYTCINNIEDRAKFAAGAMSEPDKYPFLTQYCSLEMLEKYLSGSTADKLNGYNRIQKAKALYDLKETKTEAVYLDISKSDIVINDDSFTYDNQSYAGGNYKFIISGESYENKISVNANAYIVYDDLINAQKSYSSDSVILVELRNRNLIGVYSENAFFINQENQMLYSVGFSKPEVAGTVVNNVLVELNGSGYFSADDFEIDDLGRLYAWIPEGRIRIALNSENNSAEYTANLSDGVISGEDFFNNGIKSAFTNTLSDNGVKIYGMDKIYYPKEPIVLMCGDVDSQPGEYEKYVLYMLQTQNDNIELINLGEICADKRFTVFSTAYPGQYIFYLGLLDTLKNRIVSSETINITVLDPEEYSRTYKKAASFVKIGNNYELDGVSMSDGDDLYCGMYLDGKLVKAVKGAKKFVFDGEVNQIKTFVWNNMMPEFFRALQ